MPQCHNATIPQIDNDCFKHFNRHTRPNQTNSKPDQTKPNQTIAYPTMITTALLTVCNWLVNENMLQPARMLVSLLVAPKQPATLVKADQHNQQNQQNQQHQHNIVLDCVFGAGFPVGTVGLTNPPTVSMLYQAVESVLSKLSKQHLASHLAVDKFSCWMNSTMLGDLTDDQLAQLLANQPGQPGQIGQPGLASRHTVVLGQSVVPRLVADLAIKPDTVDTVGKYSICRLLGKWTCDFVNLLAALDQCHGYSAFEAMVPVLRMAGLPSHDQRQTWAAKVFGDAGLVRRLLDRHDVAGLHRHKYAMLIADVCSMVSQHFDWLVAPTFLVVGLVRVATSAAKLITTPHVNNIQLCIACTNAAKHMFLGQNGQHYSKDVDASAWDHRLVDVALEALRTAFDMIHGPGAPDKPNDGCQSWYRLLNGYVVHLVGHLVNMVVPRAPVRLVGPVVSLLVQDKYDRRPGCGRLPVNELVLLLRGVINTTKAEHRVQAGIFAWCEHPSQAPKAVSEQAVRAGIFDWLGHTTCHHAPVIVNWLAEHQPVQLCQSGVLGKLLSNYGQDDEDDNGASYAYDTSLVVKMLTKLVPIMSLPTKLELLQTATCRTKWYHREHNPRLVAKLVASQADVGQLFFQSDSWKQLVDVLNQWAEWTDWPDRLNIGTRSDSDSAVQLSNYLNICDFLLEITDHNPYNADLLVLLTRPACEYDARYGARRGAWSSVGTLYRWLLTHASGKTKPTDQSNQDSQDNQSNPAKKARTTP